MSKYKQCTRLLFYNSTFLNSKRSNFHPFCHAAEHLSVRHERCIAECNHAFLVEENPKMAALFDGYAGLLASNCLHYKEVQRYRKIHWNWIYELNLYVALSGFSDHLADVAGAKATGTRHYFGAPHVPRIASKATYDRRECKYKMESAAQMYTLLIWCRLTWYDWLN